MPPRRSQTRHGEGSWHPLVLLALMWQFLGGLVLLGFLGWATALTIAFLCFKTCKPFGVAYVIGPAMMLINILVLITTHHETLHAMDETLSINKLLYCEITKAVPILALFLYTVIQMEEWLWLYLLILLLIPLLFTLAVAVGAKYKQWAKQYQVVSNDEERPLLAGEVGPALPSGAVLEDPPGATLAGETNPPRE